MLEPDQRKMLEGLAASRTSPVREVERAKVLLGYAAGTSITQLQRQLSLSRPMIYRCVDKALAAGVQMGLKDKYHRPHAPEITDEAKAWVVSIACTKPREHGLASELWSIAALVRFVSERAGAAGFARLPGAGKSTIWRILDEHDIKPHKIRYYLEKREPDFDRNMQEVLMVYRDVPLYTEGAVHDARPNPIYTVSVDERNLQKSSRRMNEKGWASPDSPAYRCQPARIHGCLTLIRSGSDYRFLGGFCIGILSPAI
ncbi:MAG: hypothetical protein RI925_1910 [Pseudomonadota bacterium]|jgi:transposase